MTVENKSEIIFQDEYKSHAMIHDIYPPIFWGLFFSVMWFNFMFPKFSSEFMQWLIFLVPTLFILMITLRLQIKRHKELETLSIIQRKLIFHREGKTLTVKLTGFDKTNHIYNLRELIRTENIPHKTTEDHYGIWLIFNDQILEIEDLTLENRDRIKSILAEVLPDTHQQIIDNTDAIIYSDHYRPIYSLIISTIIGTLIGGCLIAIATQLDFHNFLLQIFMVLLFVAGGVFILYKSLPIMLTDDTNTISGFFRIYRTISHAQNELQIQLEGYEKDYSFYPLKTLKKTEIIESRWKHYQLVLAFEDETVTLKHLTKPYCEKIRSAIRSRLRDEDNAQLINFENISESGSQCSTGVDDQRHKT